MIGENLLTKEMKMEKEVVGEVLGQDLQAVDGTHLLQVEPILVLGQHKVCKYFLTFHNKKDLPR